MQKLEIFLVFFSKNSNLFSGNGFCSPSGGCLCSAGYVGDDCSDVSPKIFHIWKYRSNWILTSCVRLWVARKNRTD